MIQFLAKTAIVCAVPKIIEEAPGMFKELRDWVYGFFSEEEENKMFQKPSVKSQAIAHDTTVLTQIHWAHANNCEYLRNHHNLNRGPGEYFSKKLMFEQLNEDFGTHKCAQTLNQLLIKPQEAFPDIKIDLKGA